MPVKGITEWPSQDSNSSPSTDGIRRATARVKVSSSNPGRPLWAPRRLKPRHQVKRTNDVPTKNRKFSFPKTGKTTFWVFPSCFLSWQKWRNSTAMRGNPSQEKTSNQRKSRGNDHENDQAESFSTRKWIDGDYK